MKVVLDTNVLVSGLLNGAGSPGQIVDWVIDGKLTLAYDDRIFGEYEDVLARPELKLNQSHVAAILSLIELSGIFTTPEPVSPDGFTDPDDLPFVEVFLSSKADALITGNLRHFAPLIENGLSVFSPKQFIDAF